MNQIQNFLLEPAVTQARLQESESSRYPCPRTVLICAVNERAKEKARQLHQHPNTDETTTTIG